MLEIISNCVIGGISECFTKITAIKEYSSLELK